MSAAGRLRSGELRIGEKINGYTVMSRIGRGRYGVCFLARDEHGGKAVIKLFKPRMRKKNRAYEHHEAVVLSGLSHPAIPGFMGIVNDGRRYGFVLEYKEGRSLESWLFSEGKGFSDAEMYDIGVQLFEILVYLRTRSVVHADISIANVLYDGYRVSLIDFGLARYEDGTDMRFDLDDARAADVLLYLIYSCHGKMKGNRPWYEELPLSPEQKDFLTGMLEVDKKCGRAFTHAEHVEHARENARRFRELWMPASAG